MGNWMDGRGSRVWREQVVLISIVNLKGCICLVWAEARRPASANLVSKIGRKEDG